MAELGVITLTIHNGVNLAVKGAFGKCHRSAFSSPDLLKCVARPISPPFLLEFGNLRFPFDDHLHLDFLCFRRYIEAEAP